MENHKQINNTHLLFFAGFLYFFAGCAQPPPPQPETPPLPEEQEITAKPALMVEPEPASELKQEIIVLPPIIVQDTIHKEIVLPPITIQDTVHEEIVLPKYNRVIVQDTIHKEIVLPPVNDDALPHQDVVEDVRGCPTDGCGFCQQFLPKSWIEFLVVVVSPDNSSASHSSNLTAVVGHKINPAMNTVAVTSGSIGEQPWFFR